VIPDRTSLKIAIRRMEEGDVEQVHAIDVQSFSLPWSERAYRHELTANPDARLWVAEVTAQDGTLRLVGMIGLWMILDEAHIGTIAVHPAYRRMHIGERLMLAALLGAMADGARISMLEVRASNQAAQILYTRFGYRVVGARPHYYKDNNEDALLMDLDPLNRELLENLQMELEAANGGQ
jgi:[ribosomal protein S18]-alanine N-acetyltransferase